MRTRTRTTTPTTVSFGIKHEFIPTTVYGEYGNAYVLPMVAKGDVTFELSPGSVPTISTVETMTDEIGVGRPIREVSHIKHAQPVIERTRHLDAVGPQQISTTNQNSQWVASTYYTTYAPTMQAWEGRPQQVWAPSHDGISLANRAAGYLPPSRQSELASKISDKMSVLALANTAFESKDFPALAKWALEMPAMYRALRKGDLRVVSTKTAADLRRLMRELEKNAPLKSAFKALTTAVSDTVKASKKKTRKPSTHPKAVKAANEETEKEIYNLLGVSSDSYLQWTFGISPTYADIRQITEELARPKKPLKTSFSATIIQKWSDSSLTVRSRNRPLGSGQLTDLFTDGREIIRVDGVRVDLSNRYKYNSEFFANAQKLLDRYVGANPLTVGWNMLPLSFMADWIINVEEALDRIWASSAFPDAEYWTSVKTTSKLTMSAQYLKDIVGGQPTTIALNKVNFIVGTVDSVSESYSDYTRYKQPTPSIISINGGSDYARPNKVLTAMLMLLGLKNGEARPKPRNKSS